MFINKLLRGSTNTLPVYFKDNSGLPIVLANAPTFKFTDFTNSIIVTGLCVQDNVDASKWTATFTIPSQIPLTTNDETAYTLSFTANLPNNTTKELSKLFEVAEQNFLVVNDNIPIITTGENFFSDILQITYPFTVSSYSVTLRNNIERIFKTFPIVTNPSILTSTSQYNFYRFNSNETLSAITNSTIVGGNLQAVWTYTVNGNNYTKINPIYIVNAAGFDLLMDLRMVLDKYKFTDLDPRLQWQDFELLHFVIKGVERLNATNPPTSYDLTNIPIAAKYAVQQAAIVEACKAWFLAEGQRAFEYQGQDISLNVDRTAYIQTIMDQCNSWLSENLLATKQSLAVAGAYGSRAITTISLSPTSNFPGLQARYWPASRLF